MRKVLLVTLLVLGMHATHAQQSLTPIPDFTNTPVWLDRASGSLKNFERMTPNRASRMTGAASAESLVFFAGESSSVQFELGKLPAFYVRMNTPTEDPSAVIQLAPLQVNRRRHQREYIAAKGGLAGSKTTATELALDFKRVGEGVYLISPSQELKPGEYAFSSEDKRAFLFTVLDPNAKSELKEEPHPHDPLGEAIYRDIQRKRAKAAGQSNNQ